jgi:hypothetical protein
MRTRDWIIGLLSVLALSVDGWGCAGADDTDDACVFDGYYEIGLISRNALCVSGSERIYLSDQEDECLAPIDTFTPDGARRQGILSCIPGDPVVECEGFASDTSGCSFDAYVRRVER